MKGIAPIAPNATFELLVPYEKRPSGLVWLLPDPPEKRGLARWLMRIFPPKRPVVRLDERGTLIWESMLDGADFQEIIDRITLLDDAPDIVERTMLYIRALEAKGYLRVHSPD